MKKGAKKMSKKSGKSKARMSPAIAIATAAAILQAQPTILDGKKLYKVLSPTGESQNGGSWKWDLPQGDEPGAWQEEQSAIMCAAGFHLTSDPIEWWKVNCRIFEVEADDFLMSGDKILWNRDKVVARRVRLVRELTCEADLAAIGIFRSGTHEVRDGRVIAEGSANVTAYDRANVTAYGSAKVTAYGSAKVTAYGSANVTAYDSANVTAQGNALVGTWPSTSTWYSNTAVVELSENASHVDYRGEGTPIFNVAAK